MGSDLESDCFETKYCNRWSEMKEGGENIESLRPFFDYSLSTRDQYSAAKEQYEVYKKCHKADKKCRNKGNYCACTTIMKNFLGLPLTPIKTRKSGTDNQNVPTCERNCYRVPSDRLRNCKDNQNL